MDWHFNPETGSAFWLRRAQDFDFDPRTDVKTYEDLKLFPNVASELRDALIEDLIPRGYGERPAVNGIYESGGTTGTPKRIVMMRDWAEKQLDFTSAYLDRMGVPRGLNWLGCVPTGPHTVGNFFREYATRHGRLAFTLDMDPRWVKKLIAQCKVTEAGVCGHLIGRPLTSCGARTSAPCRSPRRCWSGWPGATNWLSWSTPRSR
jgi:phenylacetate-coenzyme A ligase PaaK-like adenylate-forming protein